MLKLEKIQLTSSEFEAPRNGELKSYCLALTGYQINEIKCDSGFCCDIALGFDLFGGESPQAKLKCRWCLRYSGEEESDRELLKEHIVVAHAIPYLREFAANTLMRAGFPQLLLEPTNAFRLWEEYRKAHLKSE